LSLKESLRLIEGLQELKLPLRLLLHNKISPESRKTMLLVEETIRKATSANIKRIAFIDDFQDNKDSALYHIREDLSDILYRA
jgi:hypothetical protein